MFFNMPFANRRLFRVGPAVLAALMPFGLDAAAPGTEVKAMSDARTQKAALLMADFADRTGLGSERPARRYLWTDAFAVCNFLGLARAMGDPAYRRLALQLIDQVHHSLGRHRADDPRTGWISGLDEPEGEAHPTRGGLRIGKPLPERAADEELDEQLEWDRDGQYFHYLAQWMHALNQAARATGRPQLSLWARELAETAQTAFSYPTATGRPRMYWKMSIDLSRPLVPSMGHHDPLDAYIIDRELLASAQRPLVGPSLAEPIHQAASMIEGGEWATPDPLGIGGLLWDAARLQQLPQLGEPAEPDLVEALLTASLAGLEYYARREDLEQPAEYRLAFRELGLAIGLHAVERMVKAAQADPTSMSPAIQARLEGLERHLPLAEHIESFWLDPANRQGDSWSEHRDINDVMLATSLVPDGFLDIAPPPP